LIFKSGILNAWGKKTAVALNKGFFRTLPRLPEVRKEEADIAWLIYDLRAPAKPGQQFELYRETTVYTKRPEVPAGTELRRGQPVERFLRQIEAELQEVVV
jgi:hypothetical protein